mmetsp:Transcript_50558/g.83800  ORF Transcript_50558/g.83800 Transcript_50558/m.83800 type:complete len:267 (-) Transcript_50558:1221-2021(-)
MLISLREPFLINGASPSTTTLWNGVIRSMILAFSSLKGKCDGKVAPFFCPPANLMRELRSMSSIGTADSSITLAALDAASSGQSCTEAPPFSPRTSEACIFLASAGRRPSCSNSAQLSCIACTARTESKPSDERASAYRDESWAGMPSPISEAESSEKSATSTHCAFCSLMPWATRSLDVKSPARRALRLSKPSEASASSKREASSAVKPILRSHSETPSEGAAAAAVASETLLSSVAPVAHGLLPTESFSWTYLSSTRWASAIVK